jgi:uncharacterized protein YgiM (DUF1202 family)
MCVLFLTASGQTLSAPIATVLTLKANLHKDPSIASEIIAELDKDELLVVLRRTGNWYYVAAVSDAERGWINRSVISLGTTTDKSAVSLYRVLRTIRPPQPLPVSPQPVETPKWKVFTTGLYSLFYYNPKTVSRASSAFVRVWVKESVKSEYISSRYYAEAVYLYEFDCIRRKERVLGWQRYDKNGGNLNGSSREGPWTYIFPDTITEQLANTICRTR